MDLGLPGPVPSPWILARLFVHYRPTCARSRLIIFRPERGQPKVPFSWCRCHILDFHYRWGSIGPNETAITIPGSPRVISIFDVNGCCRAERKHFFGVLIGSRTPYGLGVMVGRRLHRVRMRFGHPIALKALDQRHWQIMLEGAELLRELVNMTQTPAYAV